MKNLLTTLLAFLLLSHGAFAADRTGVDSYIDGTRQEIKYGLNARRIVSLTPNVTEMLFFLGLGDRVVGRSSYCNYPSAVLQLPSVGGMVDTSLEKIVVLKPDLVVAYQGNSLELIGQLRQLRIKVVAFPEASSLDEIGEQLNELGFIAGALTSRGKAKYSSKAVEQWHRRLSSAKDTGPARTPSTFYGMPGEVTYTAGPGSFIDDLISKADASNVVTTGKQRWPQVNAEFILAAQPEVLLISTPCEGHNDVLAEASNIRSRLKGDPLWGKLPAVRNGHVVVINADVLLRPGPRILDALEQLSALVLEAGKPK
jgi:iron complex transport system substrate-binding protein